MNKAPMMVSLLLLIALMVFIGANIVNDVQEDQKSTLSATTSNETIAAINDSVAVTLTTASRIDASCTLVHVNNDTANYNWATANFTMSGCTLTLATGMGTNPPANNSRINVTYTTSYTPQDQFYNITSEGTAGLSNFSDFQNLFGLIIAAIIILGLIAWYRS